MIALPARLGGLGIPKPSHSARLQQEASAEVTAPLVDLINVRAGEYPKSVQQKQRQVKSAIRSRHQELIAKEAEDVKGRITGGQRNGVEQASERGALTWLTAIPLAKYGFGLNKQAFRDAICLRYGWTPERGCPHTALVGKCSQWLNQVRDITARLLTEVCPSVGIEPTLQPLNGESFPLRSTNMEEGARLDIRAQNFWDTSKRSTFFDVRVFNSHASSNSKSTTKACYMRHEREKRREYERRVLEVEHGTFTPLVLSTSGGWGPSATVAFRRLAGLIATKHNQAYSTTLQFIRCKISFPLIDSASMCLRGPCSSFHAPANDINFCDQPLGLVRREAQLGD